MNPATHQCSRRSTWRATTTSRRRRTTSSRSSPRCQPQDVEDKDAAGACKLETYDGDAELRAVTGRADERWRTREHGDDERSRNLLPHLRQRRLARAAVRADRARLHADRRRDGDDQPGARLAVRAGHVRRAVPRRAAARLVPGAAGGVPGAAARQRATRSRCCWRRCSSACSACCSSSCMRRTYGRIRSTACCSPSARRW